MGTRRQFLGGNFMDLTVERAIVLLSQMYLPQFDNEEKNALSMAIYTLEKQIPQKIECPCGYREYMEEHHCEQTDCDKCCPLALQDTINRQQAEIERLEKAVDALTQQIMEPFHEEREKWIELEKEFKTEAIKEFAERLKGKKGIYNAFAIEHIIDNLVKEMVGEQG